MSKSFGKGMGQGMGIGVGMLALVFGIVAVRCGGPLTVVGIMVGVKHKKAWERQQERQEGTTKAGGQTPR